MDPFVSLVKPADPSANRPVYLVSCEGANGKVLNYRAPKVDKFATHITFTGIEISQVQANKLKEDVNAIDIESKKEVNFEIPWTRVVSIQNLSYNKPKKNKVGE